MYVFPSTRWGSLTYDFFLGGKYINPSDYSAVNNALGTNAVTLDDTFFFIW